MEAADGSMGGSPGGALAAPDRPRSYLSDPYLIIWAIEGVWERPCAPARAFVR